MKVCRLFCQGWFLLSVSGLVWSESRTLVFQNGLEGYSGTEDTYVMSGRPDRITNFENQPDGNKYQWEWDGQDAGGHNIALIRFNDIVGSSPQHIPPRSKIVKALLQTSIADNGSAEESSTIYNSLTDWDQKRATFNKVFQNLSVTALPVAKVHVTETHVKAVHKPNTTGQIWSADLTPLVQEIVDGLPNKGFVIVPDRQTTNGFGHYSSEMPLAQSKMSLTVDTSAGIFQFEPGKNGYEGLRDVWIGNNERSFYTNYGEEGTIQVVRNAGDDVKLALIRFDNIMGEAAARIPPGSLVTSATLWFEIREGSSNRIYVSEILPFQTTVLGVRVNTLFQENNVSYENFVEDGVYPRSGVEIFPTPVATFVPRAFTAMSLDVTESLKKWVNGQAQNYGWLFESSGRQGFWMLAQEGNNTIGPPRLVVTFESERTGVEDYLSY